MLFASGSGVANTKCTAKFRNVHSKTAAVQRTKWTGVSIAKNARSAEGRCGPSKNAAVQRTRWAGVGTGHHMP